jgi:PhnB protein
MANAANPVPKGLHTLTPHLVVDHAATTIEWYKRAFGAEEIGRSLGPDGRIMHGELAINGSHFYISDVMMGKGPKELGGSPVTFWLYVADCDAAFRRAIEAGATEKMPLIDQFWGDRAGSVTDPEGLTWWIATRKEDLTKEEMDQRAADFFKNMPQPAHG